MVRRDFHSVERPNPNGGNGLSLGGGQQPKFNAAAIVA